MKYQELIEAAVSVRENAYAPYSGFKVGAAILTKSGRIFCGCNVENVSFGATVCAERAAACAAVAAGEKEFAAIAIAANQKDIYPCGICRQFLLEFGDMDVAVNGQVYRLSGLMPHAFCDFKGEK